MCNTNWYVIRREVQNCAQLDWECGYIDKTEDGMFTYACETADSSDYVIYYGYQRELWADSQDIRDYEQDALDGGCLGVSQIQQYCVYEAIKDAIMETLQELYEEEATDHVTTRHLFYSSSIQGAGLMSIPVLAIQKRIGE